MDLITKRIYEIADVVGGGTPSTSNEEYWGGDIPWLSPADLTGYQSVYISHGEKFITPEGVKKSSTQRLPAGSVLFSSRAPIGYIAIAQNEIYTNQGFKSLVCKSEVINNLYLYYYLKLNLNYIKNFASGATFPELSANRIKNIKITFCKSLHEQQKIASILSAYDSQIENNQKRIKLLEQMAENLYKEWFVRFRFPGYENAEFEGGVPKGWKIEKLSNVFNFQEGPGIRNWQYVDEDGVKFINIRCIKNGDVKLESASMISKEEAYGKYKHFLLRENDIVMSCSGTLGRSAIIRKEHLPLCLNTSVIRFWPKIQEEDFSFLYGYLHSTDFINKQSEMASGAAQVNFGPMHLKLMKLLVPPKKVRIEYHKVLLPIIQLTLILKKEIDTLSIQRDLLLPRLMSGKLSI